MTPDTNANIYILPHRVDMTPIHRLALFVYQTPTGIVWLEPSYLDPWSSAPASHQRDGALKIKADSYELNNDDEQIIVAPATEQSGIDMHAIHVMLAKRDTTLAEERTRMRAEIALTGIFDTD